MMHDISKQHRLVMLSSEAAPEARSYQDIESSLRFDALPQSLKGMSLRDNETFIEDSVVLDQYALDCENELKRLAKPSKSLLNHQSNLKKQISESDGKLDNYRIILQKAKLKEGRDWYSIKTNKLFEAFVTPAVQNLDDLIGVIEKEIEMESDNRGVYERMLMTVENLIFAEEEALSQAKTSVFQELFEQGKRAIVAGQKVMFEQHKETYVLEYGVDYWQAAVDAGVEIDPDRKANLNVFLLGMLANYDFVEEIHYSAEKCYLDFSFLSGYQSKINDYLGKSGEYEEFSGDEFAEIFNNPEIYAYVAGLSANLEKAWQDQGYYEELQYDLILEEYSNYLNSAIAALNGEITLDTVKNTLATPTEFLESPLNPYRLTLEEDKSYTAAQAMAFGEVLETINPDFYRNLDMEYNAMTDMGLVFKHQDLPKYVEQISVPAGMEKQFQNAIDYVKANEIVSFRISKEAGSPRFFIKREPNGATTIYQKIEHFPWELTPDERKKNENEPEKSPYRLVGFVKQIISSNDTENL